MLSYNPSATLRSPLCLAESRTGDIGDFAVFATLERNDSRSFAYPTSVQVRESSRGWERGDADRRG